MKPRRQGSPADSANLPIDVLRGRLAGLLGAPADIANLLRSPSPTEMFGEVNYEAPAQFPYTTEKFLKDLPLAPTSRVGQAAGQAASFVPLNPMPAVRGVQKVGQVVGEELAATMMGQRPNTMMSKVVPQPLFAVAPEQGLLSVKTEPIENLLQIKPQAPVSDIGFYSATEQAALNLGRNKGTGQSFINDIMKAPDVKKEELQFTGLEDFLRDKPNVTKQEVQDFLANNRVEVQEISIDSYKSKYPYKTTRQWNNAIAEAEKTKNFDLAEDINREWELYEGMGENAPKFREYQLPYGENYREILLTLPSKPMEASVAAEAYYKNFKQRGGDPAWSELPTETQQSIIDSMPESARNTPSTSLYRSSHFDQPNILAHMRVNDRIDADGKKMLFIEEVQSDWHQAGREQGYAKKQTKLPNNLEIIEDPYANNEKYKFVVVNKETGLHTGSAGSTKEEAIKTWGAKQAKSGVPDAPFKDTWYQLALKRALKYAADNGYERVGLTTGKQQAMRYPDEGNVKGMEKYYDEVYPNFLDKYGKKFGASVGETSINVGKIQSKDELAAQLYGKGEFYEKLPTYAQRKIDKIFASKSDTEQIRYLDIIPQMKEGALKGQPLFAATPLLPATSLLDEEKRKEITSLLE
jgi:hypothetical protein